MVVYQIQRTERVSDEDVDRVFHALADATRRDIVRRVLDAEQSISGLARRYPMSMTAVQKHVAVLEGAGLVIKQRHGREQRVVAQMDALRRAEALLDEYERLWRERFERMGEILANETQTTRSRNDET